MYAPPTYNDVQFYQTKAKVEARLGRKLETKEYLEKYYRQPAGRTNTGTSMFDPVLAEVVTCWYSQPGGLIHDPFAGDVERGVVAAYRGRRYLGIDVRPEQCKTNAKVAADMGLKRPKPRWRTGDSRTDARRIWAKAKADLVFTCPPYWNLERYSDDPADISNMSLAEFNTAHAKIIANSVEALKPNRFAVWVIGDVRDPTGTWAQIHIATIRAFEAAGAALHAEAILVTHIGSRLIGMRKKMVGSRALTVGHEYVLVFCKGDPKAAASDLGPVEVADVEPD